MQKNSPQVMDVIRSELNRQIDSQVFRSHDNNNNNIIISNLIGGCPIPLFVANVVMTGAWLRYLLQFVKLRLVGFARRT